MKQTLFNIFQSCANIIRRLNLGKIPFAKNIYRPIFSLLKPDFVTSNEGLIVYLDSTDIAGLSTRKNFWPMRSRVFSENIPLGGVVIDLGAHTGFFSFLAAKKSGPQGKVYAFEPDSRAFALLKKGGQKNQFDNITYENKFVIENNAIVDLYASSENAADQRAYFIDTHKKVDEVQGVSLDSYFTNKSSDISLINMWIQGSEAKALRGMKLLLERNPKIKLITGFWIHGIEQAGDDPRAFYKMLTEEHKFKLQFINEELGKIQPLNSYEEIEALCIRKNAIHVLCER